MLKGGGGVLDEGGGLISCGGVGSKGENETKTIICAAHEVLKELSNEPFFTNNFDKILLSIIPDIESVNYGRAVGYEVIYHEPPKEIEKISGTSIRKKYIDSNGDEIVYIVDRPNDTKDDSRA